MPSLTYAKPNQPARRQTTTPKPAKKNTTSARTATGRWSKDEHLSFQQGIARFGWGNWLKISTVIPTRSAGQTKSHAQKWENRIKLAISGQKYKLPRRRLNKSKKSIGATKLATKSAAKAIMARPLQAGSGGGGAKGSTRDAAVPAAKAEGHWTVQEKDQFARAIILHGWSAWAAITPLIPSRTTAQIKSHAQKYMNAHVEEANLLVAAHEARLAEKASIKQKQKEKRTKKASRRK